MPRWTNAADEAALQMDLQGYATSIISQTLYDNGLREVDNAHAVGDRLYFLHGGRKKKPAPKQRKKADKIKSSSLRKKKRENNLGITALRTPGRMKLKIKFPKEILPNGEPTNFIGMSPRVKDNPSGIFVVSDDIYLEVMNFLLKIKMAKENKDSEMAA